MPVNKETYRSVQQQLATSFVTLVAVSKTKPIEDVLELYEYGQRVFAENYVQEMVEKQALLPGDISWHFIGHLQSNKVKYIAPFVSLIQSIDSIKLLKRVNAEALKNNRIINCLLQIHIATEETKFGFDEKDIETIMKEDVLKDLANINIGGFMGMSSFTANADQVRNEFKSLRSLYSKYENLQLPNCDFCILSMGMSNDYLMAIEEGSNMVRIGSLLFGEREQKK